MTYQEFVEAVASQINSISKGPIYAEVRATLKNNNIEHVGLTIHEAEINISPTIYLEDFYQRFSDGETVFDLTYEILDVYEEIRFEHSVELDHILEYDTISDQIVFKLIHLRENLPMLQHVPFIRYQDLVIVFFILIDVDSYGSGTIQITNDMKNAWGVTANDIYKTALQNTPRLLPAVFKPMCSLVSEMLGTTCSSEDFEDNHMYILTNHLKQFGASAILYPGLLSKISDSLGEDFYLIPSSIHEFIILPISYSPTSKELNEMVKEINETELPDDEFLSDHIYLFPYDYRDIFICP